ncbi:S8 family peptidase [Gracilaria domingensis]|nr:S8 family peptidase [Gracilaria domingensis]
MSTCEGSDFDTYLLVLNGNPSSDNSPRVLAESANDIKCVTASNRAFISARLLGGVYYIVVTGNGASSGTYNLTVTAVPGPASKEVPWGLDRIDQRVLPLDKKFGVKDSGQGTWFYLIDSGVRLTHEEFEERVEGGYDFVNNRDDVHLDCTGHGTHVAGILAGKTYGVARKARIVSLRVYGCNRRATTSSIINALDWAVYHWTRTGSNGIIVLSLNTKQPSQALTSMMESVLKRGLPVIVPAGDEAGSSCASYPAWVEAVMTVGASDISDRVSSFSNRGNCTDIYAPGSEIESAWHTNDFATRRVSGSAQAAAHMGGVVSHLLVLNEGVVQGELVNDVIKSISGRCRWRQRAVEENGDSHGGGGTHGGGEIRAAAGHAGRAQADDGGGERGAVRGGGGRVGGGLAAHCVLGRADVRLQGAGGERRGGRRHRGERGVRGGGGADGRVHVVPARAQAGRGGGDGGLAGPGALGGGVRRL